jgi:branched-subunit amino acid ABC-type transport system permease component
MTLTTLLLQQLVNGLVLGSFYALVALGYTMVFGVVKLLNFAHGDLYMTGAFVGFLVFSLIAGTAGSTDSAKVIDALQKADYKDGLAGEITFTPEHTLARSNFIVLEGKGGAWTLAQY